MVNNSSSKKHYYLQSSLARKCFCLFGSSQIPVHCRLRNVSFKMTFCTLSASFAAQQKTSVNMFYVSVTLFHFPDFCMTVEICASNQNTLVLYSWVQSWSPWLVIINSSLLFFMQSASYCVGVFSRTNHTVIDKGFSAILVHEVSIKCHDSLHSILTLICYIHRMMHVQISLELNA